MQLAFQLRLESSLNRLRVTRLATEPIRGSKLNFDLHADIKEVAREGSKWLLRYALTVDTFPMVLRGEMEGLALLDAGPFARDKSLEELGETVWNDTAVQIFRQNFEPFYLLLETLESDSPSPWLVRDVRLIK